MDLVDRMIAMTKEERHTPKSVIHIEFSPHNLLFDARPIWAALQEAERNGDVQAGFTDRVSGQFGQMALHIATRHNIIKHAVKELTSALLAFYERMPDQWDIKSKLNPRVVREREHGLARDRVLFVIDACLFEFRSFLELLAQFVYGVLCETGKVPMPTETLSNGEKLRVVDKSGKVKAHAFVLYFCDCVQMKTDWFVFLSTLRNFFTHEGAPYCAVEDLMQVPAAYDLLVMKTNITDFTRADPSSYFRVSEFQRVLIGLSGLSEAAQRYLLYQIQSRRQVSAAPSSAVP